MIKVSATVCPTSAFSKDIVEKFELKCPECGYIIRFYYYTPRTCDNCSKPLPDILLLLRDGSKRQEYHRTGRVSRKGS